MGVASRLYGYIEEAWPGMRTDGVLLTHELLLSRAREIGIHTETILAALPTEDEWPPLSKQMFGYAPSDAPMINYKNRTIHFAATLKEVDWELSDWVKKFEALLRKLYWEKAVVHVESSYLGQHKFEWRPPKEWVSRLCAGYLEPIRTWERECTMDEKELEALSQCAP